MAKRVTCTLKMVDPAGKSIADGGAATFGDGIEQRLRFELTVANAGSKATEIQMALNVDADQFFRINEQKVETIAAGTSKTYTYDGVIPMFLVPLARFSTGNPNVRVNAFAASTTAADDSDFDEVRYFFEL